MKRTYRIYSVDIGKRILLKTITSLHRLLLNFKVLFFSASRVAIPNKRGGQALIGILHMFGKRDCLFVATNRVFISRRFLFDLIKQARLVEKTFFNEIVLPEENL